MDSCCRSGGGRGPGGRDPLPCQHAFHRSPEGSAIQRQRVRGAPRPHGGAAHGHTDGGFGVCGGAESVWTSHHGGTAVEACQHCRPRSRPLVPTLGALQRAQQRGCGASWSPFAVLSRRNAPPYPPYGSTQNVERWSLRSPGSPNARNRRPSSAISRSRGLVDACSSELARTLIYNTFTR